MDRQWGILWGHIDIGFQTISDSFQELRRHRGA
jgi:hypothetical protein